MDQNSNPNDRQSGLPYWRADQSPIEPDPAAAPAPSNAPEPEPYRPPTYQPGQAPPYTPPTYPSPSWQAPAPQPPTYQPQASQFGSGYNTPPLAPPAPDQATSSWPALEPVSGRRRRSPFRTVGPLLVIALVAAIAGSAATYGVLAFSGAIPAAATSSPAAITLNTGSGSSPSTNGSSQPASDIAAAAAKVSPAVVTIATSGSGGSGGVGSGIIFDSNGWILTNRHVVSDGGSITVTTADGHQYPGTVYGTDTLTDLAIVKIDATGLPTATMGTSADLQPGQTAIAIGDPLGNYPGSVTAGIVSGLNRSIQASTGQTGGESLDDVIQTDAAINPGNSGGPLLNIAGQVVGVNTAGSSNAQGIGFAIPIDLAKPLMQQALAGQKLARPWLGIRYISLDPTVAAQNKLPVTEGAWITTDSTGSAIVAGSPAEQAGLKENDIITAVDGVKISQDHPFIELMSSHAPGSKVTLTVQRGSQVLTLTLTLSTRPNNVQ